ncbi:hypothetical protein CBR_g12444 [Chara braunii]|uniref:Myb-like domain-containing protein n=1 Tax=Chara braunii TaxID=69332 RepID=A0A388JSH6_CHABU|nr:hypothetical protein CBR_g12444 [Chara braunii]|eukprot:GBG60707.1 hypothetical protein CBR_g12444 [Chara braunii]
MWSQTVAADGSWRNAGGEFTSLLQEGSEDDDDGQVDLRFGFSSGGATAATRTFIINPEPSPRSLQRAGSAHTQQCTLEAGVSVNVGIRPLPSNQQHGKSAWSCERSRDGCPVPVGLAAGHVRIGGGRLDMPNPSRTTQADLRDDVACRPPACPRPTVDNIIRGVSNMRAHNDGGVQDAAFRDDADDGDIEDMEAVDDDDDVEIWSLGKTIGGGKGHRRGGGRGRSGGQGGRGGASDDGGKSATYWSTDDQLRLVRCKWEQDMHLAGLGHNYGRLRTKEWRWDYIVKWMANMGTPKEVDECSKKWDNPFQNYKKIQRFQGKSGEADFFKLSNEERKEHNFKFRMERVLYNEIHASILGSHTMFPPNIADTGRPERVQLPRRGAGGGESVGSEAGGDGGADDRKAMSPRGRGGSRACGKKRDAPHDDAGGVDKGGRQVMKGTTRDVRIINVEVNEDARVDEGQGGAVPKHSTMQPVTLPTTPRQQHAVVVTGGAMPRQAVPLPAMPRQHRTSDNVGSSAAAAIVTAVEPPQPRHAGADVGIVAGAPWGATGEGRRGEDFASATEVAHVEKKRGVEDDEPLVNRVRKGELAKDQVERARLWVDDKSFWTSGEGRKLYNIINETREHLVAVANGLPLPNVPRSVAMPKSNIAQIGITDTGQLQGALSRASKVQSVALRVLHGCVFKSGSRE